MSLPAALPHGPITPVVDGIYLVRGSFRIGPGIVIGRTMTIVKGADGLVVLNAVRLSEGGQAELDKLGPVKHLVKLSESHGIDEPYYVDRYKPEVWAMPDAKFEGGIVATKTLGPACPVEGGIVIDYPGTSGWKERALWLPTAGGTLITCDALQRHVDHEHVSVLARIITPMLGFKGGLIDAPMWRKMQKVQGEALRQALAGISKLNFANLITGHGPALVGGADTAVKASIERAAAQG